MSCKRCGQNGHYQKCCPNNDLSTLNLEKVDTGKSIRDIGRAILEKENAVVERVPDDLGTVPQKGLWLVNVDRKRVAGKISQVKKTGEILWSDCYSALIESDPKMILAAGYRYLELESHHLIFEITAKNWDNK